MTTARHTYADKFQAGAVKFNGQNNGGGGDPGGLVQVYLMNQRTDYVWPKPSAPRNMPFKVNGVITPVAGLALFDRIQEIETGDEIRVPLQNWNSALVIGSIAASVAIEMAVGEEDIAEAIPGYVLQVPAGYSAMVFTAAEAAGLGITVTGSIALFSKDADTQDEGMGELFELSILVDDEEVWSAAWVRDEMPVVVSPLSIARNPDLDNTGPQPYVTSRDSTGGLSGVVANHSVLTSVAGPLTGWSVVSGATMAWELLHSTDGKYRLLFAGGSTTDDIGGFAFLVGGSATATYVGPGPASFSNWDAWITETLPPVLGNFFPDGDSTNWRRWGKVFDDAEPDQFADFTVVNFGDVSLIPLTSNFTAGATTVTATQP